MLNNWRAQGVVIDKTTAPITVPVYGELTSFPRAVLDLKNGNIITGFYSNAGIPASSYTLGTPLNLTSCFDIYVLPHADPEDWDPSWQNALVDFIDNEGGGLWAACRSVGAMEDNLIASPNMQFLSNGLMDPSDHDDGTAPYAYNEALNPPSPPGGGAQHTPQSDPEMQIMNRLDLATHSGAEQIYVPINSWRPTTTVAVYQPNHPDNPAGATTPQQMAAKVVYGRAFGDPANGLVMYEGGHSHLKGPTLDSIAAQRVYFNFLALNGIDHAPEIAASIPVITPGSTNTLSATVTGGSGTYTYQWTSTNGGIFSNPTGTATSGVPLTTTYKMTQPTDTIKLLITDSCGRTSTFYQSFSDPPPSLDLDSNTGGNNYSGCFQANGVQVPVTGPVVITDNGTTISSATVRLTNRPDGVAESLLINQTLAAGYGITVTSDGNGGFNLSGTSTIANYQTLLATLRYTDTLADPTLVARVIQVTVSDGANNSNTATSTLVAAAQGAVHGQSGRSGGHLVLHRRHDLPQPQRPDGERQSGLDPDHHGDRDQHDR